MTITYKDLVEVDLGRLESAVSDWKGTVDKLKTAAENARKGMKAKADSARWAGVNATLTREFVDKTAKEIADLHTEASSIHQVLDDAHTELVALQKRLRAAHTETRGWGIRVDDHGDGTVRCVYPHDRSAGDEHTPEQVAARQELEEGSTGSSPTPRRSTPRRPAPCAGATAAIRTTPVTARTSPSTRPRSSVRRNWPGSARR
ncbi:hypothetical protein ACFQ3Z_19825 [Streptomyces nogalater]